MNDKQILEDTITQLVRHRIACGYSDDAALEIAVGDPLVSLCNRLLNEKEGEQSERERAKVLVEALRDIARQHLTSEMSTEEEDAGDYEGAYEIIVNVSRKALAAYGDDHE